jgi:hypothetical protein
MLSTASVLSEQNEQHINLIEGLFGRLLNVRQALFLFAPYVCFYGGRTAA